MVSNSFNAELEKTVIVITVAVYLLLLALSVVFLVLYMRGTEKGPVAYVFLYSAVLCLACMLLAPLLRVRGYEVNPGSLHVKLGYGSKEFSLRDTKDVRRCPDAFQGAIRTMGNGGLFSYLGRFRSDKLGPFQAYVTDRNSMVLLEWEDRRVVVSPADADRFLEVLSKSISDPK